MSSSKLCHVSFLRPRPPSLDLDPAAEFNGTVSFLHQIFVGEKTRNRNPEIFTKFFGAKKILTCFFCLKGGFFGCQRNF